MNYSGLPGRIFSRLSAHVLRISMPFFFVLFSFALWSRCAYAEVRIYNWATVPTVSSQKKDFAKSVDYLCEASKPDMGRYSDAAIDRFVNMFTDTDASILENYHLFSLKELNAIRRRLIQCQGVFMEERHKRLVRAESGLEEDKKTGHRR